MLVNHDDVIFICGYTGSGKSTFLRWLLRQLPRWILWDIHWEHKPSKNVVLTHKLQQVIDYYNKGHHFIIYQPLAKDVVDFDLFCKVVYRLNNIMIVIEEIERYATSHFIPSNLRILIDNGRHRGIGLICTARRTKMTNPNILFNAKHIIAFKQTRPEDVDYLAHYVGEPEKAYQLPTIPMYYFLWFNSKQNITKLYSPVQV